MKIAEVSIREDKLALLTREQIFNMAINTPKYFQRPGAAEEINRILDDHGIYNNIPNRVKDVVKTKQSNKRGKRSNTRQSRRNSKSS